MIGFFFFFGSISGEFLFDLGDCQSFIALFGWWINNTTLFLLVENYLSRKKYI